MNNVLKYKRNIFWVSLAGVVATVSLYSGASKQMKETPEKLLNQVLIMLSLQSC